MWRPRKRPENGDALPDIFTARLRIRAALPEEAPRLVEYYRANRAHLAPWEPQRTPTFYQADFWERENRETLRAYQERRGIRLVLEPRPVGPAQKHGPAGERGREGTSIIGIIRYSNIQHGVCQSGVLGYSLAKASEGQGLMREALEAGNDFAFETFNLHRLEANYMPKNVRSGKLLGRLGFLEEGRSREYLKIAGRWEDHIRTALLSSDRT